MANFIPGITKLPTVRPTPTMIFQGINGETIPYSPWNNTMSGVPVTINDVIANTKKEAPVNSDFTGYPRPAYTKAGSLLGLDELAKAIMAGKFGNGAARKQALANAGYSANQIAQAQALVNKSIPKPVRTAPVVKKTVDTVIAPTVNTNTAAPVVTEPVRQRYNPSGYIAGHEAYYDPISGQLKYR